MNDDNRSNNIRERFQPRTNGLPVPGEPLVSRERREAIQRGTVQADSAQPTPSYPAWQKRKQPPVLTEEERMERTERAAQARDDRAYRDLASSLILEIEVTDASPEDVRRVNELREPPKAGDYTRIKFVAMSGGCGPELTVRRELAEMLHAALGQYLGKNC